METPEKKKKPRLKVPIAPEQKPDARISLTRRILIGIFMLGFWIYFYWFWEA